MNILVVEDDTFKFSKISNLIAGMSGDYFTVHCDNVMAAVNYLRSNAPDKIVLDMSLPSHPAIAGGGSPVSMPFGGIEIILELRSLSMGQIPIIILTQYPDVEVEYELYTMQEAQEVIKEIYGILNLTVVHYDNDIDEWQVKTMDFLENK